MTVLPAGRQFVLTWGVPRAYGGLTAALLQRSRLFDRLGGAPVTVLTCDDRADPAATAAELSERAALSPGVRVLNLWDWLRENDLRGRAVGPTAGFAPLPADSSEERAEGLLRRRVRTDARGAVVQIDHLRADGTLAVSDRRDVPAANGDVRRVIVTCDGSGEPRAAWRGVRALYAAWLDRLTAGEPAFLLVDSKAMARFAARYRRPHVVVLHVVHGSHLTEDGTEVRPSRAEVFARLGAFDAVVFCTARQARDVRRRVGPLPLLAVVPHPVARVAVPAAARQGAVVIARLEGIKRVEDAVQAARRAADRVPGLTLEVFGDGPERAALERSAGADGLVRFRGFDPSARDALVTASVLLLTSRSEAFSLVVAEAMAAGCLPIAYDVPYGPRELIDHGRTGWLVEPGNVDQLAETLARALSTDERRLARMRRDAMTRSAALDESAVLTRWAVVLRRAARRHRARRATWRLRELLRRRLRIG
ncbi:glycosyltransferase [Microbacterium sp.]|uniref:glycosyltransferase n=1 Tax=Microbacterium sp. TaxID=51671 RepID=UPI0037C8D222